MGNPRGPGKAAAVIEFIDSQGNSHKREQKIEIEKDTRNALNLKICNAAIRRLLKPCTITIFIDSVYIACTYSLGRLEKWQQDNWKRATGKPPANLTEWKQFYMLTQIHNVAFEKYDKKYDVELEGILRK